MNICATSRPITMKLYKKHHWDGGKAALGFEPDWIKTLVSMATDSSQGYNGENVFLGVFRPILFILADNDDMHGSLEEFQIQIRPPTAELTALEHLKKNPHRLIMGKRVATFSRLFLIRSISYLQVTRAYMRA